MNHRLDELTLQRLAEGRLEPEERSQFLRGLHTEDWREVALALLEEQLLRQHLQPPPPEPLPAGRGFRAHWQTLLTLCTAVLLAGFTGYQFGVASSVAATDTGPPPIPVARSTGDPPVPRSGEPVYQLQFTSQNQPEQTVQVPVYQGHDLPEDAWKLPAAEQLRQMNQQLVSQGYRARLRTGFFHAPLDKEHALLVPLHTVDVNYIGQ